MVKLDEIRPRVYVYETAGPGALAWLRSCWERVFFGPKQYELEDLGERGLAFRCTLEPRLFGPTTQQEEKALAAFKQAWEILRAGWAKVLGNLSAQERENAPRYFDFLQLKTILPIYASDGRYIEAWQALYELSLPLAPAQDSLSRPPRVLLEGEYLSLELRGNYLAKAVFAHLPVQARRGSDLFAERFTQPTAMLFKRVNGRFLAPFFMGENGASPACKEAVGVGEEAEEAPEITSYFFDIERPYMPLLVQDKLQNPNYEQYFFLIQDWEDLVATHRRPSLHKLRCECFIGVQTRKDMQRILAKSQELGEEVFFLSYVDNGDERKELRLDDSFVGKLPASSNTVDVSAEHTKTRINRHMAFFEELSTVQRNLRGLGLGTKPLRTYIGYGHTHIKASAQTIIEQEVFRQYKANRAEIEGKVYNKYALTQPSVHQPNKSGHDFHAFFHHYRQKRTGKPVLFDELYHREELIITGGNLNLIVSDFGYTFYVTDTQVPSHRYRDGEEVQASSEKILGINRPQEKIWQFDFNGVKFEKSPMLCQLSFFSSSED